MDDNLDNSATDDELRALLQVGHEYNTFNEFQDAVERYGRRFHTLFVKDNSHKSKHLEGFYDFAKLCCKQGGKTRKSESKGLRNNLTTYKCGCPVLVRITSAKVKDTGKLIYRVTKSVLEHNHPVSEAIYKSYPENRRAEVTNIFGSLMTYSNSPDVVTTTEDMNENMELCLEQTPTPAVPKFVSSDAKLRKMEGLVKKYEKMEVFVKRLGNMEVLIQRCDLMEERLEEFEQENSQLKKEIVSLKKQNIDFQEELSSLNSQMTSLERKYRASTQNDATLPSKSKIPNPDLKEQLSKKLKDQMESRKRKLDS